MYPIIRLAILVILWATCPLAGCSDMVPLGSPPSPQAASKTGYFYPPMSMSPGGEPRSTP
jgi:hypothetical protein